jgi:hypothetical protein
MDDTAIRPYRVDIPQAALDDLAGRLRRTQWPDELPGATGSYGMTSARVRDLAAYWLDGFDWRAIEARLNSASTSCTSGRRGRTPRRCCSPTAGPARSWSTWT